LAKQLKTHAKNDILQSISEDFSMDINSITVTEIRNAHTVYSKKGMHNRMKSREHYGLSLCTDGQITYIQNGHEFVSSPGYAVILPKGKSYTIRRDKTGSFPLINFDCLELICDTVTVIPIENAERLLEDYERIKKLCGFQENRARVLSIFYGMLHALRTDSIPRELAGAVRLIRTSYGASTLSNAELAWECNISEVYFRKLFTKHFGISPRQFIIDTRIHEAKNLLAEGALSIAAISEQCGFSSPYHFSRAFKQHTGATPTEYRNANLIYDI
jgi:AraC-like DNA-binding protein